MTYENVGTYFVSYAGPAEVFRRHLISRIVVVACVVIALTCLIISNGVSYMYMVKGVCWNATHMYNNGCFKKGPQTNFWSINTRGLYEQDFIVAQYACIPSALVFSLACLPICASWLTVDIMNFYERQEADHEREEGAEPHVFTRVGAGMKSVRKKPYMYRIDEVARRHFNRKLSVANIVLLSIHGAIILISFICHCVHIGRLRASGARPHAFFACVFIATIFSLVALVMSAVPDLVGFMCCRATIDASLPSVAGDADDMGDEGGNNLEAPAGDALDRVHTYTPNSPDNPANDDGAIVMPVYAYSAHHGTGGRPVASSSTNNNTNNTETQPSSTAKLPMPSSDAQPPGERARPLYGHLDSSAPANTSETT